MNWHNLLVVSFTLLTDALTELKKQIYAKYIQNKMQETIFADIDFSNFSGFIFKVNYVFMEEKDNPSEKVAKLNGTEIDGIWNLGYLPGTVFIDYECWNLKVVVYGGQLTRKMNKKKRWGVFASL